LGRPYLAPPGVPAERVEALRNAFMETMRDKDFLAEAEKAKLEITPIDGAAVQKLVADLYRTPPEEVKKAPELLTSQHQSTSIDTRPFSICVLYVWIGIMQGGATTSPVLILNWPL